MEYVTCLTHPLHRLVEVVRKYFPNVDQLISNCKKIFLKDPSKVHKKMVPNVSLLPQPVLTR